MKRDLAEASLELGEYFVKKLQEIKSPVIKEIRGRGLFIGMELHDAARPYCEKLKEQGLLCKETHRHCDTLCPTTCDYEEGIGLGVRKGSKYF